LSYLLKEKSPLKAAWILNGHTDIKLSEVSKIILPVLNRIEREQVVILI
jgi:hypothetical protein